MTRAARSAAGHDAEVAARRDLTRVLNAPPWAGGIRRWALHASSRSPIPTAADVVVAIPARDERERIGACLDACETSVRASGRSARTLVLVNGSRDGTARAATDWAHRQAAPVTVVDVDFAPGLAHVGAARRLALELAALGAAPDTALLGTDADARPARSWVGANVAHLRVGASLVCGNIAIDAREAGRLPARLGKFGALEDRYRQAALELEHLVDPDPWNPWPHHGGASGASLALTAGTLRDIGGVPLVPRGGERALLRLVRARGLRVVHADDVEVDVSGRTCGRARGGLADTLDERLREADPWCDESLQPADALHAALRVRATLRTRLPDRGSREAALGTAFHHLAAIGSIDPVAARDRVDGLARIGSFDRAWDELERAVLDARRVRLRFSALARELPDLLALVRRTRSAHLRRTATVLSMDRGRGTGPATDRSVDGP